MQLGRPACGRAVAVHPQREVCIDGASGRCSWVAECPICVALAAPSSPHRTRHFLREHHDQLSAVGDDGGGSPTAPSPSPSASASASWTNTRSPYDHTVGFISGMDVPHRVCSESVSIRPSSPSYHPSSHLLIFSSLLSSLPMYHCMFVVQ